MRGLVPIFENTGNYYYETFDISIESSVVRFVANAIENFESIDVLVNCAGAITAKANVADIKTADLEWMIKINMIAPFIFMQEVFKRVQDVQFISVLSRM